LASISELSEIPYRRAIAALLGPKALRLTPTMFEVPGATASTRAAMIKRLRAGGVFLEDATTRAPKKAKGGRARIQYVWDDEDDGT
jgi:cytochrome c-type biogenesis protein CcmE